MLKYLWWGKKPFPSYSLFADHMVSVQVLLGKKGEERKRGVDCGISSISKAEKTPVTITMSSDIFVSFSVLFWLLNIAKERL